MELYKQAASIAATLARYNKSKVSRLSSLFVHRTATAFASLLGILMSGKGVVPLNPLFPAERTRKMLERSGVNIMVADNSSAVQLPEILSSDYTALVVLLPDSDDISYLQERFPKHQFFGRQDLVSDDEWCPIPTDPNSTAYLLFTSGSTGTPKGVELLHRNLTHYVREGLRRYRFNEKDRFCQTFDFTWDTHIFTLWAAWTAGACIYVPQTKHLLNPDSFLREKEITVVELVPSTGHAMSRMGSLTVGRFPHLRYVRLGSEAVPVEQAVAWSSAAPNALVDNTYGPTECTVEVTYYDWLPTVSPEESENGIVPIGFPYPEAELLVVDDQLDEVPIGESGELLIGGPQLAAGYWDDPERTAQAFIVPPRKSKRFYRTGDLVRWPAPGKPLCFLGRRDSQIKIFGVRIELGEVEAVLREVAESPFAVALGWPIVGSGAAGIVAFLDKPSANVKNILLKMKSRLPNIMVPREIRLLERFPLNVNGKIDRLALMNMLEGKE